MSHQCTAQREGRKSAKDLYATFVLTAYPAIGVFLALCGQQDPEREATGRACDGTSVACTPTSLCEAIEGYRCIARFSRCLSQSARRLEKLLRSEQVDGCILIIFGGRSAAGCGADQRFHGDGSRLFLASGAFSVPLSHFLQTADSGRFMSACRTCSLGAGSQNRNVCCTISLGAHGAYPRMTMASRGQRG